MGEIGYGRRFLVPPPVCVGVPVYNGAEYLELSLQSIVDQTYGDFEVLISDNGSTDLTEDICREFAARDSRFRYVKQSHNMGASWNFNHVFHMSESPYFKWATHDDLLLPTFLEVCMDAYLTATDDVILCYPTSVLIDADGEVIAEEDDKLDLRQSSPHERLRSFLDGYRLSNPIFGLARSSLLGRTGLLQPYSSSDHVLMAEMALVGEFWEIPQNLFLRRWHEGMSRQANVAPDDVAAWFDPNNPQPIEMTRTKIFYEYSRSILSNRLGLPMGERLRAFRELLEWGGVSELRVIGGEVKNGAYSGVRSKLSQAEGSG